VSFIPVAPILGGKLIANKIEIDIQEIVPIRQEVQWAIGIASWQIRVMLRGIEVRQDTREVLKF